jgi:hypothetical protein
VIDYIESSLAEELQLDTLAGVAAFSTFHAFPGSLALWARYFGKASITPLCLTAYYHVTISFFFG